MKWDEVVSMLSDVASLIGRPYEWPRVGKESWKFPVWPPSKLSTHPAIGATGNGVVPTPWMYGLPEGCMTQAWEERYSRINWQLLTSFHNTSSWTAFKAFTTCRGNGSTKGKTYKGWEVAKKTCTRLDIHRSNKLCLLKHQQRLKMIHQPKKRQFQCVCGVLPLWKLLDVGRSTNMCRERAISLKVLVWVSAFIIVWAHFWLLGAYFAGTSTSILRASSASSRISCERLGLT